MIFVMMSDVVWSYVYVSNKGVIHCAAERRPDVAEKVSRWLLNRVSI